MKMSKKASAKIISLVQAIDSKASKNTCYNEAWDIISEYGDLDGELKTVDKTSKTSFTLYKGEKILHEFEWSNETVFDKTCGDWDWTVIFSEVIEYIMKNKLVKKPRAKKVS